MKELYLGALDLSPYLESITNGYILNLRVSKALQGEMLLMISQGVTFFCIFGGFNVMGRIGYIRNRKPEYWLIVNGNGDKLAFQFLK